MCRVMCLQFTARLDHYRRECFGVRVTLPISVVALSEHTCQWMKSTVQRLLCVVFGAYSLLPVLTITDESV